MNRDVIIGTVYEAWRALEAVCSATGAGKVLDMAFAEALAKERSDRRLVGSQVKYRAGSIVAARLCVLTASCMTAGKLTRAPTMPTTWAGIAAMDRATALACALGEQIRARHLGAAAFPRLHFLDISYVDIIIWPRSKPHV